MKNSRSLFWVIVSLGGFLLFLFCFYYIIQHTQTINISLPVYFILVIFVALIATAFLAGAMKSISNFSYKTENRSLYLSGPSVIFFIILYIGYKYRPVADDAPLTLTFLFYENGKAVKKIDNGLVNVKTGLYFSTKKIAEDGSVLFTGINPNYKGKAIDISVEAPGYVFNRDSTYSLSATEQDTQYIIRLAKEKDSVSVKGRLIQLPGRIGIPNVFIQFENLNKPVTTDANGDFSAVIPVKSGTEVRVIAVKHSKEIYNSLVSVYNGQLLSLGVDKQ